MTNKTTLNEIREHEIPCPNCSYHVPAGHTVCTKCGTVIGDKKGSNMTINQYFALCQSFDWYYEYSDDFRVWEAGKNGRMSLEKYASGNPIFMDIFSAWKNYNFSGSNFGKPQAPKPKWEDFV